MLTGMKAFLAIAVSAVCTFFLRALPFLFVRKDRSLPPFLQYLGKVLPSAIMAVLVVYCMRNCTVDPADAFRQISAAAVTAGIHLWKKNTYLSIVAGTAFYMLLTIM
jgi:branched-subunit amino acid transport protein AzlD